MGRSQLRIDFKWATKGYNRVKEVESCKLEREFEAYPTLFPNASSVGHQTTCRPGQCI